MITYRWPQEGGMRRRWRRWRGSWWRLRRAKKLKVGKSATKVVGRRRWTELVAARSCTGTLPPRHPAVVLSSPGTSSVSSTKLSFVIFLKTNLVGSWSKTARPLFVRFFCVLFCANFKQFWIFWDGGKTWFFFQKRSESATPDSTYVFFFRPYTVLWISNMTSKELSFWTNFLDKSYFPSTGKTIGLGKTSSKIIFKFCKNFFRVSVGGIREGARAY